MSFQPHDPDSGAEWEECELPEGFQAAREFQAEFETDEHSLRNASTSHRPDAVSRDFLTAFCVGPIGFSDTSQGAVARAWRVRVDGRDVYIAGAGESEWVDEVLWLTVPDGPDIIEVDIAFTQNADPVVCFERADGNIWIYWFDPTIPGLDLVLLGSGRNPKLVLDDPFDVTNSDVQLFYISDAQDSIVYRTQRERYATEHLTPITGVQNLYLEDAIRDSRYRMHLVASERDQVSGRYPKGFFNILSTELFPITFSENLRLVGSEVINAFTRTEIFSVIAPPESIRVGTADVLNAFLSTLVIHLFSEDTLVLAESEVLSAQVIQLVILNEPPPETVTVDEVAILEGYIYQEITIDEAFSESLELIGASVLSAYLEAI